MGDGRCACGMEVVLVQGTRPSWMRRDWVLACVCVEGKMMKFVADWTWHSKRDIGVSQRKMRIPRQQSTFLFSLHTVPLPCPSLFQSCPLLSSGLPNAPLANAHTAQRAHSPLPPLLHRQTNIAIVAKHLLSLLQTRMLRGISPCEIDERLPRPEPHAARPLPGDVGVAAVVCKTPHWMDGAELGATVRGLPGGRCAYGSFISNFFLGTE